jgi:hypothetical protein
LIPIPDLKLLEWSAWAPALPDREAWLRWFDEGGVLDPSDARPPCREAPAMLRRRYSLCARMVMETAMAVCRLAGVEPDRVHLVFGSANGESHALKALLADLSHDEPLSPTVFTNSVHHVPTGHFGMVAKHRTVSRTLSAFEDTFAAAYMDACCLLARKPDRPALVVIAEEMPPVPFDKMLAVPPFPYAGAMLLEVASGTDSGALEFRRISAEGADAHAAYEEPLFDFLKWFEGDEKELTLKTGFGVVAWRKK